MSPEGAGGDLFGHLPDARVHAASAHGHVGGLVYRPGFLTNEEAARVAAFVDQGTWDLGMRRRVQHFGYRYDYRSRVIDEAMRAPALPTWAVRVGTRLVKQGLLPAPPDQLIVNDYSPGQGIAPHVDCVPCFREAIASVSLLSPCVMEFSRKGETVEVDLAPGSAVILSGDARLDWTHAIVPRMTDLVDGIRRPRNRRVSLTFRLVVLAGSR